MEFTKLIYLDTDFVTAAYEEIKKTSVPTRVSKTEDMTAGISGGFVKAGVSAKETKEFPTSSYRMFATIQSELSTIESVQLCPYKSDFPHLFWVRGFLGVGSVSKRKTTNGKVEELHEDPILQIASEEEKQGANLDLLTNDIYFTAGYDQMSRYFNTVTSSLWLEVNALIRLIYSNHHFGSKGQVVGAPMVILKETKR